MSRFEYIFERRGDAKGKKYSVKKYCGVLSVSESGYYKWRRNRNRPGAQEILIKMIFEILEEHRDNDNYGVDRMVLALEQKGVFKSSRENSAAAFNCIFPCGKIALSKVLATASTKSATRKIDILLAADL